MLNTFCPLNLAQDEQIHMNMAGGTWPVAMFGEYTGELIISNYRFCLCEMERVVMSEYATSAERVFYPEF
jgi:hypothetical protein